MGYVIWGHGSLNEQDGRMDTSALSPGTTIQFYADLGQYLAWDKDTVVDFPAAIAQPWPAVDAAGVVPNLYLTPFTEDELKVLEAANLKWGGHTVLQVGTDITAEEAFMCTGTPAICPTDPRMITGEIPGPRQHDETCQGLLKKYAGKELHWLPCTAVDAQQRAKAPLAVDPSSQFAPYLEMLRDDPAGFATWFDSLSSDHIDAMLAEPQIRTWHVNRMVEIARGDSPQNVILGLDPDDAVANALVALQKYDFAGYFDGLTEAERSIVLGNETIAEWARENGR